jgi:hypothetical protein
MSVVPLPDGPEERARRLRVEVERLARLPAVERLLWLDDSAQTHGVEPAKLKAMVEAAVKENEKKARQEKTEEHQREQRAEKQRAATRKEQAQQQRDQQRAQEKADKEAERKQRQREKEFAVLLKLPAVEQESRLVTLAKRLGEDLDFLREEFAKLVDLEVESSGIVKFDEPWPEPVGTAELLTELRAQLRRYIIVHDEAGETAIVLWIPFAWLHEPIAVHSPILLLEGADGGEGKTTGCGVVNFLTPRAFRAAELTGAAFFHIVDQHHPTLIIDDADKLLQRRPELTHLVNVSWIRGTKIPRQDHGITRWYDVFCPKIISGVNVQLEPTTASRCVKVRFLPKLKGEKVENFDEVDNEDFQTLRRKCARWAADNAAALKAATPVLPPESNNRLTDNWILQLAIAELAGGDWPKLGREAAVKLSRQRKSPSEGKRLLNRFYELASERGRYLPSVEVEKTLKADPTSEWADWHGRGPISQRGIAVVLERFDLHPEAEPIRLPNGQRARGYDMCKGNWAKMFLHYLGKPLPQACKCDELSARPHKKRK